MAVSHETTNTAPRTASRREHVVDREGWFPTMVGPGMLAGALGAIGMILAMFLPWRTGSVYPSDVPAAFLWDRTTGAHDPSLLIFLIPAAALVVIGLLAPMAAGLRILGAVITLAVAGLFAYQLQRSLNSFGGNLGDALDTGFYFAAIGGFIALLSGFMSSGWGTRRTIDRESSVD
jgi:hypothetical protein